MNRKRRIQIRFQKRVTNLTSERKQKYVVNHEYFIPTTFHKHQSSGSVVKANYVFISAPFLHQNKNIKFTLNLMYTSKQWRSSAPKSGGAQTFFPEK